LPNFLVSAFINELKTARTTHGISEFKQYKTYNHMENKKEKFMRVFANVPEKVRGEDVVAVVDDKPFTWNTAMIEVKNNSKTGKKILKLLEKLGIV